MSDNQNPAQPFSRPLCPTGKLENLVASEIDDVVDELKHHWQRLQDEMASFEQQKRQWESERRQHQASLQEQSSLLADAWIRLETEQRNSKLSKSVSSQDHRQTSRVATDRPAPADTPGPAQSAYRPPTARQIDNPSLAEQFQMLQRGSRPTAKPMTNPTASITTPGDRP